MIDLKAIERCRKLKGEKRMDMIRDRWSIADTMRRNLASDIVVGRYGMTSVVRQMVDIEDYEATTERMVAEYKAEGGRI